MKTHTEFAKVLDEKRSKNVIVIDVQPSYKSYIHFDLNDFTNFLENNRNILYFYNGESVGFDDNFSDIIDWLCDESDNDFNYNKNLEQKLSNRNTIWYDKGYNFFRSWMDEGVDTGFIISAIRLMTQRKIYDSRDINPKEWKKLFPDDWEDYMEDDPITIPYIPLNILKKFSGSYIVGGGKKECLEEVQILMNAFNIRYKEVSKFIY